MMKKRFKLRPGVSLVEFTIVLGLFVVISTGLMSLFSVTLNQWQRGSGKSESDDVASLIGQSMVRDIEAGMSAVTVSSGLNVQMPGLNDQGDYDRTINGDLIRYYVTSGTLYRQVNGGTAGIVTTGVQSFTFTISGGYVTFTLTISRQSGSQTAVTAFTQQVALRNYVAP